MNSGLYAIVLMGEPEMDAEVLFLQEEANSIPPNAGNAVQLIYRNSDGWFTLETMINYADSKIRKNGGVVVCWRWYARAKYGFVWGEWRRGDDEISDRR